jgi:hypothetical protein
MRGGPVMVGGVVAHPADTPEPDVTVSPHTAPQDMSHHTASSARIAPIRCTRPWSARRTSAVLWIYRMARKETAWKRN